MKNHGQVCGLSWSPDGRFLASGGNDNTLYIWEDESDSCYPENGPKFEFS